MAPRQSVGHYDLLERIGVGGLGEVFRARRRTDGAVVAFKRVMASLADDPEVLDALSEEAALVARLSHPSIAALVDRGVIEGTHFIAYEFVPGRDLRAVVERASASGKPIPLEIALHVVLCVSDALAYAHDRVGEDGAPLGLVHRDLSPPNILLSGSGDVKLIDFGIARARGRANRTEAGEIKGTVGYMSPEQVRGQPLDSRSDLFSLGVVLWELCTGERLFEGRPWDVMQRIAEGSIPPPRARRPDLPVELERIVVKMLAQTPDQRYARAAELHGELSRFAKSSDRVIDRGRVSVYLRDLFPEVAALEAASREESLNMADDKGGSDLDVFEGLAKRSNRPSALTPPPPSNRAGTLIGGVGPASARSPGASGPSSVGGPPPSKGPPAPLPPPSKKVGASTLQGVGSLPPATPPPRSSVPSPPPRSTGAPAPLPPPSKRPSSISGANPLPPPSMPPASPSLGSQLGFGQKAAPQSTRAPATVDMDWDDEEESTHVYDKQKHDLPRSVRPAAGAPPSKVGAAAALLASSGGTAAPAPRPIPATPAAPALPPVPTPTLPAPSAPARAPASQSVPARPRPSEEVTDIRRRPERRSSGSKLPAILAALALLGVIALGAFMFIPRTGEFKIDVKAKDGSAVAKAEIFVDGVKVCDTTPCVARDLSAGPKTIKVIAPGAPASEPVTETVEAGKEKLVVVEIGAAADEVAEGTGFTAESSQKGIKVLVDGKDRGTLPVTLNDLSPGSHKLKFMADARYEPLEKTIEVEEGDMEELGEIKLKVLKGDLVLDLQTEGATVTLVGEGPNAVEKRLPDRLWKSPPVKLEDLDASQKWTIVAKKKGFDDFTKTITFEDGQAEQSLVIELVEEGKAPPPVAAGPGPGPGPAPGPGPQVTPPPPPPPAAATGNGTLNINSIPVSKVLLDGRPLGSTPKVGVSVSPGPHTVTFIHPEKGRKTVSVNVQAGKTATAAVKF